MKKSETAEMTAARAAGVRPDRRTDRRSLPARPRHRRKLMTTPPNAYAVLIAPGPGHRTHFLWVVLDPVLP
ncbi:MAG: hypothetical protein JWP40_3444 [Blastococcus sp.]|nr:hypothetical protein [Blastococcus sp.]